MSQQKPPTATPPQEPNKTGIVRINVTLRGVCATIFAVEKQYVLHILGVFVALGIQYAMRMSHAAICGVSGCAVLFHIT
jgi:hypothetical protein